MNESKEQFEEIYRDFMERIDHAYRQAMRYKEKEYLVYSGYIDVATELSYCLLTVVRVLMGDRSEEYDEVHWLCFGRGPED